MTKGRQSPAIPCADMPEPHPPLHRQRTARTNRAYGKTASAISTAVDYGRCETYGIAPPAISHTKAGRICQRHDETGKSRRFQSDTVTAHLTRPAKTTHPHAKRTLQEFPNRLFQHAVIAQQLLHKLAKSSITAMCGRYILYFPLHIFGRIAGRGAVTHQTQ